MEQQTKNAGKTSQDIHISAMTWYVSMIVLFAVVDGFFLVTLLSTLFRQYGEAASTTAPYFYRTLVAAVLLTVFLAYWAKQYVFHREMARKTI